MRLKQEIKQKKPFASVQEEVILALHRTADQLAVPMHEVLRQVNLSSSQYNVLRILRGSAGEPLPCGEISDRMIRRDPDLTRLLDRLESRGLVTRTRGVDDRRVVRAEITDEGLRLLESLDEPVQESVKKALAHVPVARLKVLLEILDEARGGTE
jgi:MarR family transcriptional regulator, 2-MHQ and catechol-resistance regulon repressor